MALERSDTKDVINKNHFPWKCVYRYIRFDSLKKSNVRFFYFIRRSPSPEPIYSSDGKRLNTREFRTRKKLEEQRHQLVLRMQCMNPEFKPPSDYK